jgi:hypothetical protein
MKKLTSILATASLLLATAASPVFAGGPVIVEEAEEVAVAPRAHRDLVPLILLGVVVAAIVAGSGNSNCVTPETPPSDRCR